MFQNKDFKTNELESIVLKQREELQRQMIEMNLETRAEMLKFNSALKFSGKAGDGVDGRVR